MFKRFWRPWSRGVGSALFGLLTATVACAQTAPSAPNIVVIVAEGTGFPFEDATFSKYPALRNLRQTSRPFDAFLASDAAWTDTRARLLGGARAAGPAPLIGALKAKRYSSTMVSSAGTTTGGFEKSLKAAPMATAAQILVSIDAARAQPAFIFATMDLRNVAANGAGANIDSPPLEMPAIALFDRGPLDPVRLPVIPPPREAADRSALAARRDAAFRLLDGEIAALRQGLEKRNALKKTVIVLVSAGPAPRPERAPPSRPDLLFEDWLRGMVLIQAPDVTQPGISSASIVQTEDIAPTIADLAGATVAKGDGLSLAAALRDPKVIVRDSLLSSAERQAPRIGRSIRTDQYRFTQWPDGTEELFDEKADPREWKNLAGTPAAQAIRAGLLNGLKVPPRSGAATPARPTSGRRLNVLMIIADDLTAQYGQFADVKTPNLDRLKARGRSFDKAYAPAPFCTPSRAAFLSGMSPSRLRLETENVFGEVFTPGVRLIQEQFRDNGYFTASVGKVWDSQPGEKRGWDLNEWQPPLLPGAVEKPAQMMKNMPVEAGTTTNSDEAEGDGRRARFAVKVMEQKRDKPYFLALGFVRPHVAWVAPKKYFDMYPPAAMKFTPAPADDTRDIPAIAIKNRPQSLPGLMLAGREPAGFSNDPAEAQRGIAAYLACVTFMDAQLGVVLDALDREDRWKDTIVVFFGDNGHHFGDHGGLWRKNTLFEESLRVPMVIAAPGLVQPGKATAALADLIDVYPTLVELTGIARPSTLDGVSLQPLLKNPAATVQASLIQYRPTEPPKMGYSLRTARYRYTLWPDGSEELYDLSVDPAGRKDLSRVAVHAATMASLRKTIEKLVPST